MSGEDAFKVEGKIVEVLSGRTYRVELSNGHRLLGFVTQRASRLQSSGYKPGDIVKLAVSPFDLSRGKIVVG
jgi:translation initiation factor IF-1